MSGKTINVLDHGRVTLIDFMGNDKRIVDAARVSIDGGKRGTGKTEEDDKRLIRYLAKNRHTSPFEQCEAVFYVKCPIFVARQWVRHRTACLTGDNRLTFDLPCESGKRSRKPYYISIQDLFRRWNEEHPRIRVRNRSTRTMREFQRDQIRSLRLRMCDEDTGLISYTHIEDIYDTGINDVYRVTFENGKTITSTANHRYFTDKGWKTLVEAVNLRLSRAGRAIWDNEKISFASNGECAYQNEDWLKKQRESGAGIEAIALLAGCSYHTVRKYLKKYNLQYTQQEKAILCGLSQRGQKRGSWGNHSEESRKLMRLKARKGENSNFWKGGVTSRRALIGTKTTEQAHKIHQSNGFRCQICHTNQDLQAHHIIPVYKGIDILEIESGNLTSLCANCHNNLHRKNLEDEFISECVLGIIDSNFFNRHSYCGERNERKQTRQPKKLCASFARIKEIEYVGKQQTYDIAVSGPYHNFVCNGLIVHNSYNEASGRYSTTFFEDYYLPSVERLMTVGSPDSRQGGVAIVDENKAREVRHKMEISMSNAMSYYKDFLASGASAELARSVLPVSVYTEFYVKNDLHNWMHFLNLRLDSHAQYEIRVYAEAIRDILRELFPIAMEGFSD